MAFAAPLGSPSFTAAKSSRPMAATAVGDGAAMARRSRVRTMRCAEAVWRGCVAGLVRWLADLGTAHAQPQGRCVGLASPGSQERGVCPACECCTCARVRVLKRSEAMPRGKAVQRGAEGARRECNARDRRRRVHDASDASDLPKRGVKRASATRRKRLAPTPSDRQRQNTEKNREIRRGAAAPRPPEGALKTRRRNSSERSASRGHIDVT